MMLPRWDLSIARQRPLEAKVSIAMVKTFPEARWRRLPLRTAMAKVPDSKPIAATEDAQNQERESHTSTAFKHLRSEIACEERVYALCGGDVRSL